MFKPSVGRIVHFVLDDKHYAAIITQVHSDTCVDLQVFFTKYNVIPESMSDGKLTSVRFTMPQDAMQLTCHWPERTE